MILLTGAAGFIGSCMLSYFNRKGLSNIIITDDFSREDKNTNLNDKKYSQKIHRDDLFRFLEDKKPVLDFVIHIGARTDTTEFDVSVFDKLNLNYTKLLWKWCADHKVPMVYASSAATYGMGELGYKDDHTVIENLKPLNPYGESKNDFDKWALKQEAQPPQWYGLKFFNVYGPNEFHKARMASVIFHAYNQIQEKGEVKLFRSHNPEFEDGKQLRDFIFVKDVVEVIYFLTIQRPESGLYNLGTGNARSFLDLAINTFKALDLEPNISFIDTPVDIRDKYQYFTEADMDKLRAAGYTREFTSLEDGIHDYVKNYLSGKNYY